MNKISKNPRHRFDADIVVGRRLRSMRNLLGRSQMDVANAIGITFQQLQKYEKGSNRISAGRIHQLAVEYSCPVAWFFGDYDNGLSNPLSDEELHFLHLLRSCNSEGKQIIFKLLETYRSPSILKQTNFKEN